MISAKDIYCKKKRYLWQKDVKDVKLDLVFELLLFNPRHKSPYFLLGRSSPIGTCLRATFLLLADAEKRTMENGGGE